MKRLLLLPFVASLLSLTLLAPSANAITDGQVDTGNRYPFVGLLAFYDAQGEYVHRCTGTLLSPTVVLTAAHCTDGMALVYAYFQITVPDDFRENPTGISGTPFTHPDFNPNTLNNDVGIVVLDQPVNLDGGYPTVEAKGSLRSSRRLMRSRTTPSSRSATASKRASRLQPRSSTFCAGSRSRRTGASRQNNLHLQQNPNSTEGGGTCFGDSGGPHFWQDTLIIVSVTSWGDAICRSNDMTQRLDIESVQDFLAEFGI